MAIRKCRLETETQIHSIVGNGQPGEISKIKDRLGALERGKYWLAGAASVAGAVVGIVAEIIRKKWFGL